MLSMLLAGYQRGGQATRLEPVGDSFKTVAFDVYGPKALACIGGLPSALASRCISLMMFRAGPDSPKPKRRIDADPHAWQVLRDDLHALALEHGVTWLALSQQSAVCKEINARGFELWQPILALAGHVESNGAEGLLELMQRYARLSLDTSKDDQVAEADEILFEILANAILLGQPPTPGEILAKAKERDPSTFDRWKPQTVSRRLKTYNIPIPRKSNGQRRYRHVTMDKLRRIQRHYGIDLDIPDPSPESSTLIDPVDPVQADFGGHESGARVDKGQ